MNLNLRHKPNLVVEKDEHAAASIPSPKKFDINAVNDVSLLIKPKRKVEQQVAETFEIKKLKVIQEENNLETQTEVVQEETNTNATCVRND